MGAIVNYTCKCGYEAKLFIGCGMAYNNKNIIRKCVPEQVYEQFEEDLSAGAEKYCLSHAVICCEDCRELFDVCDLTYSVSDEMIRYTAPCPECGLECEPLSDTDSIFCPKCKAEMTREEVGHWD